MTDIFEEVEEGLRQDKLTEAWKKYGIFAYIGAAALLGGVGLYEYMQHRSAQVLNDTTMQLESAIASIDDGAYEDAGATLSVLIDSDARQATVAGHHLARVEFEGKGDRDGAIAALQNSIKGDVDQPSERLALLKTAYLKADTSTRAELETLLEPLRATESEFGTLAVELIAAKAVEEGDYGFARKEFNYLMIAPNAPRGVKRRAQLALETLPPVVVKEAVQDDEPAEELQPETQPTEADQ